jgi:hypothetical protein
MCPSSVAKVMGSSLFCKEEIPAFSQRAILSIAEDSVVVSFGFSHIMLLFVEHYKVRNS